MQTLKVILKILLQNQIIFKIKKGYLKNLLMLKQIQQIRKIVEDVGCLHF